ncbi:MAG: ABC transporter substrate-binding protein [Acidimicrobiales bacterium]
MSRTRSVTAMTIVTLCALVAVSCTDAKLQESAGSTTTTTVVGTGGGPVTSGDSPLRGMRGATPGIEVTDDFRQRIAAIDPTVGDFAAAAEGYDSVTVIAIAAEAARSDAPGRIASGIVGVTGVGHTCISFARCRSLVLHNDDADYDGVSGSIEMQANGDPGQAGFAIVGYDGTGALRTDDHVTVQAKPLDGRPVEADPIFGPPGDGVLTIGTLLPVSGPAGASAAGALAGVQLAVRDINDHGGVLGDPMVLIPDESGDGSSTATTDAVQRLLGQQVDAIVGGTTYAVTSVALAPVTDAGVILFSPTDTARALSIAPDHGLFFRVAPPTDLEGQVLGNLVTDDGYTKVAIISGPDDDDIELASDIAGSLNAASASVTTTVTVKAGADLGAAAQQALDSAPQAIVLATPVDVAAGLIKALVIKGKGPATLPTYGTAGNMGPELAAAVGGGN